MSMGSTFSAFSSLAPKYSIIAVFLLVSSVFWSAAANADVLPQETITQSNSSEVDSELQRLRPAIEAFQRGDADAFKIAYSMITKDQLGFPAMEVYWAKLLLESGKAAEAMSVAENYIRSKAEDPDAYILMGRIALASGRWTDAWLQFEQAQKLIDAGKLDAARSKYVTTPLLELRAQAAERRGRWKEAEEFYTKAQALNPDSAVYGWGIGKVRVYSGEVEEGFRLMSQAIEKDASLPPAALSVAQILAETTPWAADKEAAKKVDHWFKQAVDQDKSNSQVMVAYFNWLLLGDRAEDVVNRYDNLSDDLKQDPGLQLLRGLAARYMGDLERAEAMLVPLHQANAEDPEVANQLALVLVESKDEAKRGRALQLAERNLRQMPNSETVVATAAWIQFRLGSGDVADRMLGELAQRVPLSAQSAYYASELLASRGLKEESQRMLRAAVESPGIFPQRAAAKAKLGQ